MRAPSRDEQLGTRSDERGNPLLADLRVREVDLGEATHLAESRLTK